MKKMNVSKFFKSALSLVLVLSMLVGCSLMFTGCNETANDNPSTEKPEELLQDVVTDKLDSWVTNFGDAFESLGNKPSLPEMDNSKFRLTLTVGDTLLSMLESVYAQQTGADMDFSFLSKINFDVETDVEGESDKLQMLVGLNGQQIITLNLLMNLSEYVFYAGSPELSDTYIKFDASEMMGSVQVPDVMNNLSAEKLDALLEALPDGDTLVTILDRYTEILLGAIKDVDQSTTTLEVEGVSQQCVELVLNIYEADAIEIVKAVLTTAKDDADLKVIIEELAAAIEELVGQSIGADSIYTNFKTSIESALATFNEMEATDTENPIQVFTYLDAAGEVIGMKFATPDNTRGEFYFYSVTEGDTTGFVFAIPSDVEDADDMRFAGTATTEDGVTNGQFTFSMQGISLVELIIEDFDNDSGSLLLKPTAEMLAAIGLQLPFENVALQLKVAEDGFELNLLTGDAIIIGIAANVLPTAGFDFNVSDETVDATDSEAMQNWASSLVLDKVLENLEKAGAGEFIEFLESLYNEDSQVSNRNDVIIMG